MKAKAFLRLLKRQPLAYRESQGRGGSHRRLVSDNGHPPLLFSFHDGTEIGGTMIRKVLVEQVGLDEATALGILQR